VESGLNAVGVYIAGKCHWIFWLTVAFYRGKIYRENWTKKNTWIKTSASKGMRLAFQHGICKDTRFMKHVRCVHSNLLTHRVAFLLWLMLLVFAQQMLLLNSKKLCGTVKCNTYEDNIKASITI